MSRCPLLGAYNKYAFWIDDLESSNKFSIIKNRIEAIKLNRSNNTASHKFCKMKQAKKQILVVPRVSSENRDYLPISFFDNSVAVNDSVVVMYDPEEYIFGIISSKIHMVWLKAISGKLETRYRYSSSLVYNTFPFPKITQTQKENIEELVHLILDERDKNFPKTMAELYDPNKMPEGLKQAHHNLDIYIESCYRDKPFENDEERLEYLFRLYEKMIKEEVT